MIRLLLLVPVASAWAQQAPVRVDTTQARDTALFVSLPPPPVHDRQSLESWLRIAKQAYGVIPVREAALAATVDSLARAFDEDHDAHHAAGVRASILHAIGKLGAMSADSAFAAAGRPTPEGAQGRYVLIPDFPVAADERFQPRPLTAAELASTETEADLKRAEIVQASRFVEATFNDKPPDPLDVIADGFSDNALNGIARAVRQSDPRRATVLAILDSGWPTARDKEHSFFFFDSLAREARKLYGITAQFRVAPFPAPWQQADNTHVDYVAASIAPLLANRNDSLLVVYFPLAITAADQDALRDIILTDWLIKYQHTRLNSPDATRCTRAEVDSLLRCFRKYPVERTPDSLRKAADAIVKRAVEERTDDRFAASLRTTVDIYNAVWTLLEVWSYRRKTTAFISASWTAVTDARSMPATPRISGRVLTVAAAGNTNTLASPANTADFVRRAFSATNFVLVENQRTDGAYMCGSTRLDRGAIDHPASYALFYFGYVRGRDPKQCGTSFAAPRVAWTLAFSETLRGTTCPPSSDSDRRQQAIIAAQKATTPYLWPIVYLQSASGAERLPVDLTCPR